MHDQLPPPLSESSKFLNSLRASDLAWLPPAVHSNCSEAVCLAARTLLLQCRDLRQYREVSTHTILPNFIGNCRDSVVFAFWQRYKQREKEEAYIEEAYVEEAYVEETYVEEAYVFNLILPANQGDSPGQPERSLRTGTCVRYNYHIQLVAI